LSNRSVIGVSILLHGSSATLLLEFYQRQKAAWQRPASV